MRSFGPNFHFFGNNIVNDPVILFRQGALERNPNRESMVNVA
jgi:hypothetical protein